MRQLMISASRVLDGTTGRVLEPGAVLSEGKRITAVGDLTAVSALLRTEATRMDYPGATVLPGLIDTHVHLAFAGTSDPVAYLAAQDDDALFEAMAGRAGQLLDAGVTTARDLGDRGYLAVRLRDSIAVGERPGPRLLSAGAPLTPPGGHCWFLGGEVGSHDQIRALIASHAARGVDCIKVMASGGCITPDSPPIWQSQFTDEDLRLIVDEAASHGLPVAAHAHSTAATRSAAAAGVASIEHCRWLTSDTFDDPDLSGETAAAIARKGIFVCPTIGTAYGLTSGPDFVAHITRVFRWQEQHGIQIAGGTDVGVYPFELYPQHRYLDAYERAGFPTARIIGIHTRHAAAALGLGAYTGTLAAGYSADLIVVDGDPFADISALRRTMLVVAQGDLHLPNRINAQVTPSSRR